MDEREAMVLPGRGVAFVAAMTVVVLAGGCTSDRPRRPPEAPAAAASSALQEALADSAYSSYVALGDSFTAGPYVPSTDLAEGCLRSSGNYPSLVAAELNIATFTDVRCSGAKTRHLTAPQPTFRDTRVPAQLAALTRDTDLVTLGIGGNDFDLFANLLRTCTRLRPGDPKGSPCADRLSADGADVGTEIREVGNRVAVALERIEKQAPDARVLLVGYPRIAPEQGTCPARLPLADGDYALANEISRSLHEALRRAAGQAGVGYVDLYTASEGHDVCAEHPWVNGRVTDQNAALMYHPFPAEMQAAADLILDLLAEPPG